jgi:hypothetical protein
MEEKRKTLKPIPDVPELYLIESQLLTVQLLKESGWNLWFVRRTDIEHAMPVLFEDASGRTAIIDKGGDINIDHGLEFRNPEPLPRTSMALARFLKGVRMNEHLWFTEEKTGDLILAAHTQDPAARISKDFVDFVEKDSNSIHLDWIKSRIEKDFGYHN